MARAKGLNVYPQEYWDIVKAAATEGKKFSIELPDLKAGLKRQGRYYAFRGALQREVTRCQILFPNGSAWMSHVEAHLKWSQEVACWIERGEPPMLYFMHRSNTPEAKLLRAMLDAEGVKAPEKSVEDELAARLIKPDEGGKYG